MGFLEKLWEWLGIGGSQKNTKERVANENEPQVDGREMAARGRLNAGEPIAHHNCGCRNLETRVSALERHKDKVDSRIETFNNRLNYNDGRFWERFLEYMSIIPPPLHEEQLEEHEEQGQNNAGKFSRAS